MAHEIREVEGYAPYHGGHPGSRVGGIPGSDPVYTA